MRLAGGEMTLRVGSDTLQLRPTLRAATRLERHHGGFDKLLRAITDGNLTAMLDVVTEGSNRSRADILNAIDALPLNAALATLTGPLVTYVLALAGQDDGSNKADRASAAERITFAEYHAQLFRIATGWLGWTPDAAWNATPAEIVEAHKGRVDMLKAIYGGSDDTPSDPTSLPTEEQRRAGVAMLKTMGKGR